MMSAKGKYDFSTSGFTAATADHAGTAPMVDTSQVAPNPLNSRRITRTSPRVIKMRKSIARLGQLEASTVVTRAAFVAIFPEFEAQVGSVAYVQNSGGQRLMACTLLGRQIKINVNDEIAADRSKFVASMAEENIGRDDLDAVEEATAIALLVQECGGNQSAAARQMGRSQPWVHQYLNLLKLDPAVQDVIREHSVAFREVRGTLYRSSPAEQMATVLKLIEQRTKTAVIDDTDESDSTSVPQQRERVPRVIAAVRRLAKTPADKLGAAMLAELTPEYRRALVAELTRED